MLITKKKGLIAQKMMNSVETDEEKLENIFIFW